MSHILFLLPERASDDDVAQRQAEAEARVAGNPPTAVILPRLARQYSEGPSAERGGLLGTFQANELLPGFDEATAGLQPGDVSDVIRTRVGLHIIRLEDRQADSFKSFDGVQEDVAERVVAREDRGQIPGMA